jgi:hypothetical protein
MIPCLASAVMPLPSYPDSRYGYDDEAMMVVALPGAFWPDWADRIAYLRASGEAPDANTLIPTRAIFGGPIQFAADSPLEGGGFELTVPGGSEPEDWPLALVALGYCRSILRLALAQSAATVGGESCVCA